MSNNINNNTSPFENYMVQIPEAENFPPTSISKITKIMTNLKQNNSVGWDNSCTTTLKFNVDVPASILSNSTP